MDKFCVQLSNSQLNAIIESVFGERVEMDTDDILHDIKIKLEQTKASISEKQFPNSANLIAQKDAVFSNDIEMKVIERKLAYISKQLQHQGVDLFDVFQQYDHDKCGCITRTDFVDILARLGYVVHSSQNEQNDGGNLVKESQISQIRRLKSVLSKSLVYDDRVGYDVDDLILKVSIVLVCFYFCVNRR